MSIIKVKNRSASRVGYLIPDSHIRRVFAPGEIKEISTEELEKLAYQPGGMYILINHLQVEANAVKELKMETPEREYYYSEDQVKTLMKEGTLDEFLDCLDFAPAGVIDLIKKYAIELPLTDLNKMNAIKEKTGFDALTALKHEQEVKTTENEGATTESTPKRRVAESKYKVIS